MLPDILTKPHSDPSLLQYSSWAMNHSYLSRLPLWNLQKLSKPVPISTLPHFLPNNFKNTPSVSK